MERLESCVVCGGRRWTLVSRSGRDFTGQAIHACLGCGVFFQSPRPDTEELARYYQAEYSRRFRGAEEPDAEAMAWRDHLARDRFERLCRAQVLTPGHSLLEIGCGAGNFLRLAHDHGMECRGVEPSRGFAAKAQQGGLAVESGMFPEVHGDLDRYDVIALFHVLEHLPDPLATLTVCREMLENEGRLVVEVPDLSRALGPTWTERYFHLPHLFDFTEASLDGLLRRGGFEPRLHHHARGDRRRHHLLVVATTAAPRSDGGPREAETLRLARRVRRRVRWAELLRPAVEGVKRLLGR